MHALSFPPAPATGAPVVPAQSAPGPVDVAIDLPGKTRVVRCAVVQRIGPPLTFVAPPCLGDPSALGRVLRLWQDAFRAGDVAQLILPVAPAPDHMDRAVAAVQQAAASHGVDLDGLADIVLTTIPGATPADVAGVASPRASWIALDGRQVPEGSCFTAVAPDAAALRSVAASAVEILTSQGAGHPADGPA
jgi:hypothetical protein